MTHPRLLTMILLTLLAAAGAFLLLDSCNGFTRAGRSARTNGTNSTANGKHDAATKHTDSGNGGTDDVRSVETSRVVIGDEAFDLEIAADPAAREQGLMHRTSIAERGGMIFVFPDNNRQVGVQSFWMKNCLVDMDLLFLDRSGRITAMHRMKAQPPQRPDESNTDYEARMRQTMYGSGYPAQFAIELRAGWLDQLNLKVEQHVTLELERLKGMAR